MSATSLATKLSALAVADGRTVSTKAAALRGWVQALDDALEDGLLSEEEEERLGAISRHVGIGQGDVGTDEWARLVKAATLRDLMNGIVPARVKVDSMPVSLQKSEQLVWAFPGTEALEQRTRRSFSGVSHGLSIRIARGVYYRPSVFQGSPVLRTETVSLGQGTLVVTTKHLYFASLARSFRVPYAKIVAFQLGVQRDGATAKPLTLVTGDGWFTYNLVTGLAQL